MSKGEQLIKSILENENVRYQQEKIFTDLRNGKMRFDFFLPELGILTEVDGQHHFQWVKKFHRTKQEFNHAKQNDRYKNSFALARGYRLYRIPFWEIDNIRTFSDITQDKFLVTTSWHNDIIYREYLSGGI